MGKSADGWEDSNKILAVTEEWKILQRLIRQAVFTSQENVSIVVEKHLRPDNQSDVNKSVFPREWKQTNQNKALCTTSAVIHPLEIK